MKKTFDIRWAAAAERDLLQIVEYIAAEDVGAALDVLNRIKARADRLNVSPMRGRIVPELLRQGISRYREIVIRPWRVIYRVEEGAVFVVLVIDGRRNVEDALLERMLR